MALSDTLRHPYTSVGSGLAVLSSALGFLDPIFALVGSLVSILGATAGTWFPLLGVLSTLGEGLAFIPASVMNNAFLVGAVVYAAYLSDSLWERLKETLKQS